MTLPPSDTRRWWRHLSKIKKIGLTSGLSIATLVVAIIALFPSFGSYLIDRRGSVSAKPEGLPVPVASPPQSPESATERMPSEQNIGKYKTIYEDEPLAVPIGGCFFQTAVDLDPVRPAVWDKQYVDGDEFTYMQCTSSGFVIEGNAIAALDDPSQDTPSAPTACLSTAMRTSRIQNPREGDVICIRTDRGRIVRMKVDKVTDGGALTATASAWEPLR
jgi:hypothetical protein